MAKEKLILIGGGGHTRSCIDVIESEGRFDIVGIVEKDKRSAENILGYPIIGSDDDLPDIVKTFKNFFISIGQIGHAHNRIKVYEKLKRLNVTLVSIVSPTAHVAKTARLGEGTIVMHKAVINTKANIGFNTIINTGAIIEHDVLIGNHCHISTGAIINGECRIGHDVFIGSGSVLRETLSVCDNVILGLGALVVHSIEEQGTYVGQPIRKLTHA